MRTLSRLTLIGLMSAGFVLVGCGDSGSSTGGTTDTTTPPGDTTTPPGDTTTPPGDTTAPPPDTKPPPEDTKLPACTSDDECTPDGDSPCQSGTCKDGKCETGTAPDGTVCDDGKACTINDQCNGGNCAGDVDPDCTQCTLPTTFSDYASHVIEMTIPTDTADFNCDANNDGKVDAADGNLNDLIKTASAIGMDLNATLAENVASGSLLFLPELTDYEGGDDADVTINFYVGDATQPEFPDSCNDLANDGTACAFSIDPVSFDEETCKAKVTLPGASVSGNTITAGPQDFSFSFPLGDLALDLEISDGSFSGDISGKFNLAGGRLCGSVDKQVITDAINNACDPPTPATEQLCGFKGVIMGLLTCDPCTIVLGMEGVEVKELTLGE